MAKKSLSKEIDEQKKRGILLVLTGPIGAGKDSLFTKLLSQYPSMVKVTTTTSRSMRRGESEGNPYHFISREEFEQMIARGEFFEWVEFRGELYGTPKKMLEESLQKGTDIIWHIEEKGMKNIKEKVKEMYPRSVFVFLTAPTIEELEERVKKDETKPTGRWNEPLVAWEMEQYDDCDYLVVNEKDKLDETVEKVLAIMAAKRLEILH